MMAHHTGLRLCQVNEFLHLVAMNSSQTCIFNKKTLGFGNGIFSKVTLVQSIVTAHQADD